jgi:hypothetical protein
MNDFGDKLVFWLCMAVLCAYIAYETGIIPVGII